MSNVKIRNDDNIPISISISNIHHNFDDANFNQSNRNTRYICYIILISFELMMLILNPDWKIKQDLSIP